MDRCASEEDTNTVQQAIDDEGDSNTMQQALCEDDTNTVEEAMEGFDGDESNFVADYHLQDEKFCGSDESAADGSLESENQIHTPGTLTGGY